MGQHGRFNKERSQGAGTDSSSQVCPNGDKTTRLNGYCIGLKRLGEERFFSGAFSAFFVRFVWRY